MPLGAQKQLKDMLELVRTEGFRNKVHALRNELSIDPSYFDRITDYDERRTEATLALSVFNNDLVRNKIREFFPQTNNFTEDKMRRFIGYLLFDTFSLSNNNFKIVNYQNILNVDSTQIKFPAKLIDGMPIFIKLFSNTTKDDLVKHWKAISVEQRKLPSDRTGSIGVFLENDEVVLEVWKNTKPNDVNSIWDDVVKLKQELPDFSDKRFKDYQLHPLHLKIIEAYENKEGTAREVIDKYGLNISTDYFYKMRKRLRKNSL